MPRSHKHNTGLPSEMLKRRRYCPRNATDENLFFINKAQQPLHLSKTHSKIIQ